MYTSLTDYYTKNNIDITEGYSQQVDGEIEFLKNIVTSSDISMNDPNPIRNVMEIGFNAGHSAELFLNANPDIQLVSFDIGDHEYLKQGKKYIDEVFPGRHQLILGNSVETIPTYAQSDASSNGMKFDVIFIDGGHDYYTAKCDLIQCKELAHENSIVIIDDTVTKRGWVREWNIGPNRSWREGVNSGLVIPLGNQDYRSGRGVSWGKYNLSVDVPLPPKPAPTPERSSATLSLSGGVTGNQSKTMTLLNSNFMSLLNLSKGR